jgi:MazG family protein
VSHRIEELQKIMARLRDPREGCPWDLKQEFSTIAPYTIEEAYEVADAIVRGDLQELKSELGDLLFQVVFHARLAEEQGAFDFDEVVEAIVEKMRRRHPHVFGDAVYHDEAELKEAWEAEKQRERRHRSGDTAPSALDGVARALPALVRADKLQKRAARVGFDWPDAGGAMKKVEEELAEVHQAVAGGDADAIEDELGDLLFAAVNVARLLEVDAEQALRRSNDKFARRFRIMEQQLRKQGVQMEHLHLEALDEAWEQAKEAERDHG